MSKEPEELGYSDLYWRLIEGAQRSPSRRTVAQKKKIAEVDAALDFFNDLSYEDQLHVRLLMRSAKADGYEDSQSDYGEGP